MKYFLDTEFIEGFHKPLFGKRRHFIDLISIAIVAEDGREYSAVSNEYNYKDADQWVKDNVIVPLYLNTCHGDQRNQMNETNFHKSFGKSTLQISMEIEYFIRYNVNSDKQPFEFYGYYADYDWVLFCSLFGRMIDLPKGFPMYCKDLKQILDEKALSIYPGTTFYHKPNTPDTLENRINWIKVRPGFPKQQNEHSALDDAKWNKKLYEFLQAI